jgi:hypothetical protein
MHIYSISAPTTDATGHKDAAKSPGLAVKGRSGSGM